MFKKLFDANFLNRHSYRRFLEQISDSENDAIAYCSSPSSDCESGRTFNDGLIKSAEITAGPGGAYVQVTGCLDSSKFPFAQDDSGGQLDVRFPNGAQCSFGGYGASFIEKSAVLFCFSWHCSH